MFCAGDTPALQSMGGFVMGVGNAKNPCRECLILKNDILEVTKESQCQMREKEFSKQIASSLKDKEVKDGISRYTQIYEFQSFDPIKMTPQDPMHILLEGVARRLIIDFIKIWIQTKRTSLPELNMRIQNFNWHHNHKNDKLKLILNETLLYKSELIISANQMRVLLNIFPFIFSDICDLDSQDYELINLLRIIVMISFDFYPNSTLIDKLEDSVENYIKLYKKVYEKGYPKLHYLVHLPKWIRK